jgi:hypothetical protein
MPAKQRAALPEAVVSTITNFLSGPESYAEISKTVDR